MKFLQNINTTISLETGLITTLRKVSLKVCKHMCCSSEVSECHSFLYHGGDYTCTLLNFTQSTPGVMTETHEVMMYYEKVQCGAVEDVSFADHFSFQNGEQIDYCNIVNLQQ